MNVILSFLIGFCSVDTISSLFAKMIVKLMEYARNKGGNAWDVAKKVLQKVKVWIDLFLQVYDDDNLTEDEEKMIAEAIRNQTDIQKIVDILKEKVGDGSEGKSDCTEK